jgi:hypothetical protein
VSEECRPKPPKEPAIEIQWGGKTFHFASKAEALKAGFHLDDVALPAKPDEPTK